MAIERKDEILAKALPSDNEIIPRYRGKDGNGNTVFEHVELQLENEIQQEGMPYNKAFANEVLAASGIASGSNGIYSLTQPGFLLLDGALVRFRVPENWGDEFTLNVNETGALPVLDTAGEPISTDLVQGAWVEALYSSAVGAYFFKSGGGSLKFKIVGGIIQPVAPTKNTLWINTSNPVSGKYIVGAYKPTNTIGEDGTAFMFLLGEASRYVTLTETSSKLAMMPLGLVYLKVSGNWARMNGQYFWDGSQWVITPTVLFDGQGDYGSPPSGGWGGVGSYGISASNLNLTTTTSGDSSVFTVNPISLAPYRYAEFLLGAATQGNNIVGFSNTKDQYSWGSGPQALYLGSNYTFIHRMDVSAQTGSFYARFRRYGAGSAGAAHLYRLVLF